MHDILITGTDTGIGKTIIAAALVKALRASGIRALGFKPFETGCDPATASDSEVLQRASGEMIPLATPLLRLAEPLAPAVAAERAGTPVHPEQIEQRIELLRRAGYTLVVEGAGGVMAPLAWEKGFYTVLDLAARCGLDAIVVARPGLGTLNHVTMTVDALRSRNISVRGVVLNGRRLGESDPDIAELTNPAALARMLPCVRIVEVPRHDAAGGIDVIDAVVPYLAPLL